MQQNDETDDCVGGGSEDGRDGAEFVGALGIGGNVMIGHPPDAIDEEEDDAQQDEGIDEYDDEGGKVATNKAEEVMVPGVPDLFEGKLREVILRGSGKKEHYCGISDFSELTLCFGFRTSISRFHWLDAELRASGMDAEGSSHRHRAANFLRKP